MLADKEEKGIQAQCVFLKDGTRKLGHSKWNKEEEKDMEK